jgi:hypothetical protein
MTVVSSDLPVWVSVLRRFWLSCLLLSLVLGGLCSVAMMLLGGTIHDRLISQLLAALAIAPIFLSFCLVAAVVVARGQLPIFMVASMAVCVAAMVGWIVMVWRLFGHDPVDDPLLAKILLTLTMVGGGTAMLGYLLTSPARARPLVITRTAMLWSGLVLGACLMLTMWSRLAQRWMIVVVIGLVAGTVGLLLSMPAHLVVVRQLRARRRRSAGSVPRRRELELLCPACGRPQLLKAGLDHCRSCGVAIQMEIEEPRCECGYLLYRLQGETCPECGRLIPEIDRRAAAAGMEPGPRETLLTDEAAPSPG